MAKREALITPIEDWDLALADERILVIDVHQDWSGSCADVVEPFFKKLWAETDNRVKFLSASRPALDAKLKSLFPSGPATTSSSSSSNSKQTAAHGADGGGGGGGGPLTDGCTPLFLLVKNKVVVGTVVGIDIGMISTCVKQHLSIK